MERSFKVAWHEYIRHRIVSLHAKRIIAQFMAACCGKSTTEDPVSSTTSFLPTETEKKEPCNVSLEFVHGIISQGSKASSCVRTDEVVESLKMSDQIKCSLRLGSALWSFDSRSWDTDDVNTLGHRPCQTLPSSRQARKQECLDDVAFKEKVYMRCSAKATDAWFAKIQREEKNNRSSKNHENNNSNTYTNGY